MICPGSVDGIIWTELMNNLTDISTGGMEYITTGKMNLWTLWSITRISSDELLSYLPHGFELHVCIPTAMQKRFKATVQGESLWCNYSNIIEFI